jgi:hypothetical protein
VSWVWGDRLETCCTGPCLLPLALSPGAGDAGRALSGICRLGGRSTATCYQRGAAAQPLLWWREPGFAGAGLIVHGVDATCTEQLLSCPNWQRSQLWCTQASLMHSAGPAYASQCPSNLVSSVAALVSATSCVVSRTGMPRMHRIAHESQRRQGFTQQEALVLYSSCQVFSRAGIQQVGGNNGVGAQGSGFSAMPGGSWHSTAVRNMVQGCRLPNEPNSMSKRQGL